MLFRSGVEASVAVKPSYGLSDERITQMLKDSFDHASVDVRARALREQQVEAERMLAAVRTALSSDGALLEPGEREAIDARVNELEKLAGGEDHRAIKLAIDGLNKLTEPFAARRMDRSVRAALAGRNVASV